MKTMDDISLLGDSLNRLP